MKIFRNIALFVGLVVTMNPSMAQVSKDSELYKTLKAMDSTYFTAYNTCDVNTQADILAEDIEFYQIKEVWPHPSKKFWKYRNKHLQQSNPRIGRRQL